jgi:F420-dependent methylenetetrahydromethanopterin dehydrogenase
MMISTVAAGSEMMSPAAKHSVQKKNVERHT